MIRVISKVMLVYHMGGGGRKRRMPGFTGKTGVILQIKRKGKK